MCQWQECRDYPRFAPSGTREGTRNRAKCSLQWTNVLVGVRRIDQSAVVIFDARSSIRILGVRLLPRSQSSALSSGGLQKRSVAATSREASAGEARTANLMALAMARESTLPANEDGARCGLRIRT